MRPETMNIEDAREYLSNHFGRSVDDIETEELDNLYNEIMLESKQSTYTGIHEELLSALNLILMSRRGG